MIRAALRATRFPQPSFAAPARSRSGLARPWSVLAAFAALVALAPGVWGQPLQVEERAVEYRSGDVDVPAFLAVPKAPGPHPAVLFVHGRSGWHDRLQAQAVRLAARGFVVLAPDYHTGRMIPENPIAHDPATERDVELGLDFLKTVKEARTDRIGVVGISRGGYHMLLLAVRRPEVVALVGYYPHLASPNDPEPVQVYRYAPEVERVRVPTLLMVGDHDHQLRRELVARVGERLRELGVPVEVVVYPGAQRAFDFRRNGRTLGDDLAREDALNRTAAFLGRLLGSR
ncbi:MAG TPA: dienelactone hydrolase family protein [Methylomirabilota bacterium]|nr:dienelactone hydrolase family protein [Methylomirabilota bacterium]